MGENLMPVVGGSIVAAATMSSREIAELVESRHDTVKVAMDRLRDRGLITFTSLAEKSSGGRPGVVYHVGKRDSYVIVAQLSPEFTARLVDRWQELEQETSRAPQSENHVAALSLDVCFAQAFFGTFKVSESSKLAIFRQIGESHGANTSYLPKLVVDEAPGLPGTSAATAPLTDLLKARGARLSAHKFNLLLERAGYLQKHTRKTSSKRFAERGGVKPFWSITLKGLEFGKNMVAPESPRETVPHWYVHKFDELRERIRPFYRRDEPVHSHAHH